MEYDIFISCKSEDYELARSIYTFLVNKGYSVFLADTELRRTRRANFGNVIDEALEKAKHFVLFSSNSDYVKSTYVEAEWRTFLEELRCGRKNGNILTIRKGFDVVDLPISLRRYTSFTYDEFQSIIDYLPICTDIKEGVEYINKRTHKEEKPLTMEYKIIQAKGVEFKMIKVDGGTFDMGSENSNDDEKPVHKVTLSDYYIAETPVTQELWCAIMEKNPSYFKNVDFPVERVSWDDCIEFIKELNLITGAELRLPTEAEWEYAARGGKYGKGCLYSGNDDINQVAWWAENSENTTHVVKTKLPNELGVYDMSGNVWEWCNDNFALYVNESVTNPQGPIKETYKVQRGGCWDGQLFANKDSCKVTYRSSDLKTYSSKRIGLRLAMGSSDLRVREKKEIMPNAFKLTIAGKDIYMLLSANKKYYIGNILDSNSQFKWLSTNSEISVEDAMMVGAIITGIVVAPILTLCVAILKWIFKSEKDKSDDEIVVDENFCKAISGEYKFSIPNVEELEDVVESEKSHCFVLRLSDNPKLKELLKYSN